jgi:hypothetical protein
MPLTKAIKNRFNLWRKFLSKNKGKYTRDELVRKFHKEYGYGVSGSKRRKTTRRPRKKGKSRRRKYKGGAYDSDDESCTTSESE